MKSACRLAMLAILTLSFFACEHSLNEGPGGFAIYLLADSTITAVEAAQQPLAALALARRPLISEPDLVFYQLKSAGLLID